MSAQHTNTVQNTSGKLLLLQDLFVFWHTYCLFKTAQTCLDSVRATGDELCFAFKRDWCGKRLLIFQTFPLLLHSIAAYHQLQLTAVSHHWGLLAALPRQRCTYPTQPQTSREKRGVWVAGRRESMATGLLWARQGRCWRAACRQPWLQDGRGSRESCFENLPSFHMASQDFKEFASSLHKAHILCLASDN